MVLGSANVVLGPRLRKAARKKRKNVIVSIRKRDIHNISCIFFLFLMQLSKSFFGRCCEYKIICFSFKDFRPGFRQQSPGVSHTSVDERFSARSKIVTKHSACIRGVKKRELVDMCRDDFQNNLQKQRPSLFILGSFVQPRS